MTSAVTIRYMSRHKGFGDSMLIFCAAAAPSLISSEQLPDGQNVEAVNKIISDSYKDRPSMLRRFWDIFFHRKVSQPLSDWCFASGLQASSWSTIAIAKNQLAE